MAIFCLTIFYYFFANFSEFLANFRLFLGQLFFLFFLIITLLFRHENLETNLRHRGSGRKVNEIGRQQVVKIDDDEAFLGLQCNDDALYLLTKNSLWRVIPDDVEN